jgi:anti-anti-sigma factor
MNEERIEVVMEVQDGAQAVVLRGSLDSGHVRQAHDDVRQAVDMNADITVDLAGVAAIDASGLQVLLVLQAELRRRGRALRLRGVPEIVSRALVRAGLERSFEVPGTAVEAARG